MQCLFRSVASVVGFFLFCFVGEQSESEMFSSSPSVIIIFSLSFLLITNETGGTGAVNGKHRSESLFPENFAKSQRLVSIGA